MDRVESDTTNLLGEVLSGAGRINRFWIPGQTLRVRFIGGSSTVRSKVSQYAQEIFSFTSLDLQFVESGFSEIRVSFVPGGSWSYVGSEALSVHQSAATMNFGWFNNSTSDNEFRRTTLHEFGHALGMIHEHQHPEANIPWDEEAVYRYYTGPPNNWSRATTNHNIFRLERPDHLQFTDYDVSSVMHYSVWNALTIGDFTVPRNTVLSTLDKRLLSEVYAEEQPDEPRSAWFVSFSGSGRWKRIKYSEVNFDNLRFGDFNGDGKTDVFRSANGFWYVSFTGGDYWVKINRVNVGVDDLRFGDFDGDGKTDVFRAVSSGWHVKYGGRGPWVRISTTNVDQNDLHFGDFDGDGKTDVFRAVSSGWHVKYGGRGSWHRINVTNVDGRHLKFGDFNGDGKTDVFRSVSGSWHVKYGGRGSWRIINSSNIGNDDLKFGDFDGDGKADIIRSSNGTWRVSYGGTSSWQTLNNSNISVDNMAIGDFNGDGESDVFRRGYR